MPGLLFIAPPCPGLAKTAPGHEFHFFQAIKKLSSGFWRLRLSIPAKFVQNILMFNPSTIALNQQAKFIIQ